ncbi:serine/threonine-protein kinase [Roseimaritima ulvae]|uniref:Serine/threonine-protein kinase PrkC n=1 Tax=Roseimaritima ulvae TaxID=980254 RepID=A0A5B9QQP6_9BACT|nr:serine/threonine-protein kinase [Roseimaritima ulvae]QEG39970.1 Serine/threonine-protein kinase PrkC [Roseimaritima ulvae]
MNKPPHDRTVAMSRSDAQPADNPQDSAPQTPPAAASKDREPNNHAQLKRDNPVMAALAGTLDKGRRLLGPRSAADTPTSDHVPTPHPDASHEPLSANAPKMHFTYASGSSPLARYTIRRGVGIGGFGEVYFAVSEAGKEVALKRVQRNLDVELRGVSHCLNLKHPNLVSLFDVCRDDEDQAWVVMEYIAGPNLREVLDRSPGGLPTDEVLRCFAGLAAGVAHLHDSGVVHRDLKPGNIFDDAGSIKIGDYGLSKFISCSRRGGHTESIGTFHYMAPEIGRGEYGREIDIYAMGVILCELLTGRVPFDGESSHEIVMKHLTALPDLSDIAAPFRDVIARSLEKDPQRRPQSVAEMVRPLGIQLDSYGFVARSVPATPVPPPVSPADEPPIKAKIVRPTAGQPSPPVGTMIDSPRVAHASPDRGEEPLARALRGSLTDLARWWKSLESYPGTRLALMIMAIALVMINTGWLLPLLSLVAIVYVPYYIVRQMVLGIRRQPSYAEAHQMSVARARTPRPVTLKEWRVAKRNELGAKRSLTRMTELSGAWTTAGFTTVVLTLIAGLIGLRDTDITALTIAPYALTAATVATAAMVLLGMGKLWERDEGEPLARRLVLSGVGAIIGAFVYAASHYLLLPTGGEALGSHALEHLPQNLYHDGAPRLVAMMAHFALLMGAVGWWKNTDPLRTRRVSLWAVAVAVVVEWGISQFLPIPQPWGMLMAGGTALVLQMTAPWENPRQRPKTIVNA